MHARPYWTGMCVYIPTQVLATMYGLANTCTCYTSQVPRLCFSLKMAMLVRIRSSYVTCLSPPFPLDSVCIIPEEVGSSCSIIGTIVVALRRGSLHPPAFLGTEDGLERLDILCLLRVVDAVRVAQGETLHE